MGRKQLSPQRPPCRADRKTPAYDTVYAGRSYRAVARWAKRVQGVPPGRTANASGRGQRGPPIPPRPGPMGSSTGPGHVTRSPQLSREGITRAITTVY